MKTQIQYIRYPLAQRVLAVAVVNHSAGDWAAYIDAVPGENHGIEFMTVTETGDKMPWELARIMFARAIEAIDQDRENRDMKKIRWRP